MHRHHATKKTEKKTKVPQGIVGSPNENETVSLRNVFNGPVTLTGKKSEYCPCKLPFVWRSQVKALEVSEEDQSAATRILSKGTPARAAAEVEALLVE